MPYVAVCNACQVDFEPPTVAHQLCPKCAKTPPDLDLTIVVWCKLCYAQSKATLTYDLRDERAVSTIELWRKLLSGGWICTKCVLSHGTVEHPTAEADRAREVPDR